MMKAFMLLTAMTLATLLHAKTLVEEKYVHVVSSYPIYEKVHRLHNDSLYCFPQDRYERNRHYKKHKKYYKRHRKHIVGYKNIGYYNGMKIVKKSHQRLRNILIEVAITF